MKDSLIVLSGGIDSVTLLYEKKDKISCALSFNYGGRLNAKEIPFASHHCARLGIPHFIVDLDFIKKFFRSSLLKNDDFNDVEFSSSTVVPFRNGIMLSIAAGVAESKGLKSLLIANHFGDHEVYPDCRSGFIFAMQEAIKAGTYSKISIDAPYTSKRKAEIVDIGNSLNVDYSQTWSCYRGGDIHCGECATCRERKQAFALSKVLDPTIYEK